MKYQWIFIVTLIMGNLVFAGQGYQSHVYSGLFGHGTLGPNTGSTGCVNANPSSADFECARLPIGAQN